MDWISVKTELPWMKVVVDGYQRKRSEVVETYSPAREGFVASVQMNELCSYTYNKNPKWLHNDGIVTHWRKFNPPQSE